MWFEDTRHGAGVMTFARGGGYEGQWQYDKESGQGHCVFPSGDKYSGQRYCHSHFLCASHAANLSPPQVNGPMG